MAKILIVDDELNILDTISNLLESEGHETVTVLGGQQAVDLIKNDTFDLMISDIMMKPINGMELLRLAHDVRPDMAVIMLTAYGQVDTAVEAMELGAFEYVAKPFKIDKLLDAVAGALEMGGMNAASGSSAE